MELWKADLAAWQSYLADLDNHRVESIGAAFAYLKLDYAES